MFNKKLKRISIAIVSILMIVTSVSHQPIAAEEIDDSLNKINIKLEKQQDIYIDDEFNIEIMNYNVNDLTYIEIPEGLTYIDSKDETISYDQNSKLVSIPSASKKLIRLKAEASGEFRLKYKNTDGSMKDEFNLNVLERISNEIQGKSNVPNNKVVQKSSVQSQDNGVQSVIIQDGSLGVDVENFTNNGDWQSGETKQVKISIDFGDTTSIGKNVSIKIPEGMKYIRYDVKGTPKPNSPEKQLSGELEKVVSNVSSASQTVYNSYNDEIVYNITSNAQKVEMSIWVSVDETVFYEEKKIENAIQVNARKEISGINKSIGNVFVNLNAKGSTNPRIYDERNGVNNRFGYKDTDELSSPYALVIGASNYVKEVSLKYYLPIGTEVVSVDGSSEGYNYSNETGLLTKSKSNSIGDIHGFSKIIIKTDKLEKRDYSLNSIEYSLVYYDGVQRTVISTVPNTVSIVEQSKNSVPISYSPYQISKFDTYSEQKAFGFNTITNASQGFKDQTVEIKFDEDFDATRVVLPKPSDWGTAEFEFTTKNNSSISTGYAKSDNQFFSVDPNGNGYYYITKDSLGLSATDQLSTIKMNIGDVKKGTNNSSQFYTSPGVYGKSKSEEKKAFAFEIRTYGPNLEKPNEVEEPIVKNIIVSQYPNNKDQDMRNEVERRSEEVLMQAGESKDFSIELSKMVQIISPSTSIIENPSITMQVPDGVTYSDFRVTQNYKNGYYENVGGRDLSFSVSPTYYKDGKKYIRVDINGALGLINKNEYNTKIVLNFKINTSESAYVNTDLSKLFWISSDKSLTSNEGDNEKNFDDKTNSGNLNQTIVPYKSSKKFLVTRSERFIVDTFFVPKGGSRQEEYNGKPETAIGFTPNSEGLYTIQARNNTTEKATKLSMYVPIPKEGYNYGSNFQDIQPFNWNMRLTGGETGGNVVPQVKVTGPNGENWTDTKGKNYEVGFSSSATNASDYEEDKDLSSSTKYSSTYTSDSKMIRVRNTAGIEPGETAELQFRYVADETNQSAKDKVGKVNDFNPYYWLEAGGIAANFKGTKVGVILQMGTINGVVFEDVNKNGLFDAGEELTNKTVRAKNLQTSQEFTTETKSDGSFEFADLAVTDYEIDFNSAIGSNERFTITNESEKGSKATNKGNNVGKVVLKPTDANAKHVNAGIIKYPADGFDGNISMGNLKLVEPKEDGTLHADSKKTNTLVFDNEELKNYIDPKVNGGKVSYSVENPDVVSIKEVENNNFAIEVTAKRGVVAGTTAKTKITATFTDIYGRVTSTTFTVDVASNNTPEIQLTGDYVQLLKGTEYTIDSDNNVSVVDLDESIPKSRIVIDKSGLDVNKIGVQSVIYNVTDSQGNAATPVTRKVVVYDKDNPIKEGYQLQFNKEYSIDIKNYPNTLEKKEAEAYSKSGGNVKVTRISDGSVITPTFDFDYYKALYGKQSYSFKVPNTGINETITVEVTDKFVPGNEYTLYSRNVYIGKNEAAQIKSDNSLATESVKLMKPFAKKNADGSKQALKYVGVEPAFDGKPGTYEITFANPANEAETIKANMYVLNKDHVLQVDELVIAANDFRIGKKDITDGVLNFNDRSQSIVFNVMDKDKNLGVNDAITVLDINGAQNQNVTLKALNASLPASLKLDVTATLDDGKVVEGDEYVLVVNDNVELQKFEAQQYISEGHGVSNGIITKLNAKAYKRDNLQVEEGTVEFKNHTFTETGNGTATFGVVEEGSKADVSVNVRLKTDTVKPVVTIEQGKEVVELKIGDSFNYKDGVSAQDIDNPTNIISFEKGNLVADKETIDTSVRGVYTITYTATDKNGVQSDPKVKIVTVSDTKIPEVGNYYIVATNVMEKTDVFSSDAAANKAKLIEKSGAYAISKTTGERREVEVTDLNGFTNKSATYKVQLKVKGINTVDSVTLFAALTNGDIARGDSYFLTASDKTIGTDLAESIIIDPTNVLLFDTMDVRAIPKYGTQEVLNTEIKVSDKITEAVKQEKNITFNVLDDSNAKLTNKLTVTKDGNGGIEGGIYLGASNFVIGRETIKTMKPSDYLDYAGANAYKVDPFKDLTIEVKQGLVDYGAVEQEVIFKVVNEDRELSVKVKVVEGRTVLGDNYVISGKNFSIDGAQAKDLMDNPNDASKDSILLGNVDANLNSYKRYSLKEAGSVVVQDRLAIKNEVKDGGYATTYRVSNGATTEVKPEIELMVGVNMGTAPTLNFKKYSEVQLGGTFKAKDQFIDGSAINDGKATLSYNDIDETLIEGSVDVNTVGIYPVTFKYIDSYGLEATATHVVVVTDGSTVITDKHIIYGENVMMSVDEAKDDAASKIKSKSHAYAYEIESGKKVSDDKISIELGDFKASVGQYTSKIKVSDDPTTKDIQVVVTNGPIVTDGDYSITANPKTVIGKEMARAIVADTTNEKLL